MKFDLDTERRAPDVDKMVSWLKVRTFLAGIFMLSGAALAAPPAAPTGLTVQTLGVNSFYLTWNDNSSDEVSFRTDVRFYGETTWYNLDQVGSANGGQISTYEILGSELLARILQFRIAAVKGAEESYSNVYTAPTTPSTSTFNAPTGLTGSSSDGVITLNWNDNANSEWGYEVESRQGTNGDWIALGQTQPNQNSNLSISGHIPNTVYQYRVRARKGSPASYTAYSNVLTIPTLPLVPPTQLVATLSNERDIRLTLRDNSAAESGYLYEYRVVGTTEWSTLGTTGPNVTDTSPITDLFDPATDYEFRVRAFSDASNPQQTSEPSNIATISTTFAAPSTLVATPVDNTTVQLSWEDLSSVEQGYGIYMRKTGDADFQFVEFVAANAELATIGDLAAGTSYDFQVAAAYQAGAPQTRNVVLFSQPSIAASAATRDAMTSPVYVEAVLGQPLHHVIAVTTHSPLQSITVSGLPDGVTHSATEVLSGAPQAAGVFECPLELAFADGWKQNISLTIRVLRPPVIGVALPAVSELAPMGTAALDLGAAFVDPDADSAVRISTNLGDMDCVLFNSVTPLTVANFMAYVLAGDYAGAVFHRSVPGFVIQGGGFRADPGNGPAAFVSVPARPTVRNEPGLSSVRGTLAMAKLPDDPDSASNQFFVNLANNGPILNNQNGGFTVFGRVLLRHMGIPDAIAELPTGTYNVTLDGGQGTMADWPLTASSTTMDSSLAVKILAVNPIPVLVHAVVSNSHPEVVGASIAGSTLNLHALHGGTSTLVVRATDLEGNTVDQSIVVNVPLTLADWTGDMALPTGESGPEDDADGGSLPNAAEFAFMGNPTDPTDDNAVRPMSRLNAGVLSMEFNLRKNAHLHYILSASSQLAPPDWTVIWHSAHDGVGAANVDSLADLGDHYRIRVADTNAPGTKFLLLEVREPTP